MNADFYKEKNKRILKVFGVLLVVLCFCAGSFYISFYGSELLKGLVSAIVGALNCCVAIDVFRKVKLGKMKSDYKVVAVVMFISGLVYIYVGIDRMLRFYY